MGSPHPAGTVGQSEQHVGLRPDGRKGGKMASTSSSLLLCKPKGMGGHISHGADTPPSTADTQSLQGACKTPAETKCPPLGGFLCHPEELARVPALTAHQSFKQPQRLSRGRESCGAKKSKSYLPVCLTCPSRPTYHPHRSPGVGEADCSLHSSLLRVLFIPYRS